MPNPAPRYVLGHLVREINSHLSACTRAPDPLCDPPLGYDSVAGVFGRRERYCPVLQHLIGLAMAQRPPLRRYRADALRSWSVRAPNLPM